MTSKRGQRIIFFIYQDGEATKKSDLVSVCCVCVCVCVRVLLANAQTFTPQI
jgi:hypothetical protein